MRIHRIFIPLSFIAAQFSYAAAKGGRPEAGPAQAPAKVADPMASFARLIPGEWRVTAQSGTSMFHAWHWGPGKHSIRRMTDGADAAGNPWRELRVMYWHPGRKQVRLLGLAPFGGSVMEGTIHFEGDTADAAFDLYQSGVRRDMGLRWAFDGPDKYRETLLEATGPAGLAPLAEWDFVRSRTLTAARSRGAEPEPKPSERLKALGPLLGHTWEASGDRADGDALHTRSTFEWIPYIDAIYARVLAPGKEGEPEHLLDAYFYHHTGTNTLRCLALSNPGGVYEGDLTVLDGGALELDLKGYEGDRVVSHVARFEFEQDGTLHHRAWSLKGPERTLLLDVHHKKVTLPPHPAR